MRMLLTFALLVPLLWTPALRAEDGIDKAEWSGAIRRVAKSASPAVVSISTARTVRMGVAPKDGLRDPLEGFPEELKRRFRLRIPNLPKGWEGEGEEWRHEEHEEGEGFEAHGQGSGVIVDAQKGIILTNHHVVDSVRTVKVHLQDGRVLDGTVVGSDPKSDIAVVRIASENLKAAGIGDSDAMETGDWVVAIGAPFGLDQTVTAGIVSAKGRINVNVIHSPYAEQDFLQTDAAINPGNSGGPLLNLKGEVIGINTAIAGNSGGNLGVGFAVPSKLARRVMEQILEKGRVVRGWLGVAIQDLTPELAEQFGAKEGVILGRTMPGSPAEKAGLKAGDLLVGIGGERIGDVKTLRRRIMDAAPGRSLDFLVQRDGKELTLPVTVGEQPGDEAPVVTAEVTKGPLGLSVQDLTPELAETFELEPGDSGVVVAKVIPNSAAAEKGIRPGDLILSVNRKGVASVKEFEEALAQRDTGKGVLLLVKSGKDTAWVVLK